MSTLRTRANVLNVLVGSHLIITVSRIHGRTGLTNRPQDGCRNLLKLNKQVIA
jgi:hypothetical protein